MQVRSFFLTYGPLLLVTGLSFAIRAYDPLRSPVLGASDPWYWTALTRKFLVTGDANDPPFTQLGYPPTFMYLMAAIARLASTDPYNVARYLPVAAALDVVPIYLLALTIFRSRVIAASGSLLTVTSRYYFIRTSIAIPEGLANFFVDFTLLFILLSLTKKKWAYIVFGVSFMAMSFLYYHFTLLIIIPFLVMLMLAPRSPRRETVRTLLSIAGPALVLSGVVWYFWVLIPLVHNYTLPMDYANQPVFQRSIIGFLFLTMYSVAKSAAIPLAYFGYTETALSVAGIALVLMSRWARKESKDVSFLFAYLVTLVLLTVGYRIIFNATGSHVAELVTIYMYSWLTMPAAIFAGYGLGSGSNSFGRILTSKFRCISKQRAVKTTLVCMLILLCLANLSSLNYYKATSHYNVGLGFGILQVHYYPKVMSDQTYYALDYIRHNSATGAIVLVAAEPFAAASAESMVAERSVLSISSITQGGSSWSINGQLVSPNSLADSEYVVSQTAYLMPEYLNLTDAKIRLGVEEGQKVYIITEIKEDTISTPYVESGSTFANKTSVQMALARAITNSSQYRVVYRNDQVAVFEVSASIDPTHAFSLEQHPISVPPKIRAETTFIVRVCRS